MLTNRNHATRFTLVELLVVMAIISILAAMLMPALRKAKEASYQVKCANSMRMMGLAMAMYSSNNNGMFTPVCDGVQMLMDFEFNLEYLDYLGVAYNPNSWCYNHWSKDFLCPNSLDGISIAELDSSHWAYRPGFRSVKFCYGMLYWSSTYIGTGTPAGSWTTPRVIKEGLVRSPSNKFLFLEYPAGGRVPANQTVDLTGWATYGNYPTMASGSTVFASPGYIAFRHGNGQIVNTSYIDGHVAGNTCAVVADKNKHWYPYQ